MRSTLSKPFADSYRYTCKYVNVKYCTSVHFRLKIYGLMLLNGAWLLLDLIEFPTNWNNKNVCKYIKQLNYVLHDNKILIKKARMEVYLTFWNKIHVRVILYRKRQITCARH